MSRFHSTLNRRDFMKALGLSGAGIGMAGAMNLVFKDLDEAMASPTASLKRPWWVKERELENPTCEVDWNMIKPMDNSLCLHGLPYGAKGTSFFSADNVWNKIMGHEYVMKLISDKDKKIEAGVRQGKIGCTLRDTALNCAALANFASSEFVHSVTVGGPHPTTSPEFFGVPRWEGTPAENARMIRSAARFLGASQVQYGVVNEKTRNLIFNRFSQGGQPIVFENVDKAYSTPEKFVLPGNKQLYFISVAIQMHKEGYRQGQTEIRNATNISRYRLWSQVMGCLQTFLGGIGYQGIGYPTTFWGLMPASADAILSGQAEMSRNDNVCISPEFGSVCGYYSILTDLPLEPSPPIDAGVFRFCHTCRKCAETCPEQCISYDAEPSWEIPGPTTAPEKEPVYSTPGKKVFHTDATLCMKQFQYAGIGCSVCMGNCVFNTNQSAMVHDLVKGTVSTTGLFNGFLWKADKFFGYGITPEERLEDWWDSDYPSFGFDNTISASTGGYGK